LKLLFFARDVIFGILGYDEIGPLSVSDIGNSGSTCSANAATTSADRRARTGLRRSAYSE